MQIERGFTTTTPAALGLSDEEVLAHIEIVGKPPVPMPLDSKDIGDRPQRDADYRLENEALLRLTDALANRAANILDVLCDCAMSVCEAGSAGISLIKRDAHGQPNRFVWAAVRGAWAAYAGCAMPIDESPCAHVIALNDAILFEDPLTAFPDDSGIEPKIHEVLLAPFHLHGRPAGTVWVLSHAPGRRFDLEDRRRLMSVARFASAAYQAMQAEQALSDAQRRIRLTLNNAQIIGLWEWDVVHDVARADERCAALVGVDRDRAAKGLTITEFIDRIHPGDRARVADEIDAVALSGEAFASEYRLLTSNGETRHLLARGSCEKDAQGQVLKFHGVVIDVTERRRAERTSRVSAQQFRMLAQVLPNHIWTAFPDGRVEWVSDQVYEYTKVEPGTLEGRSWVGTVHPDDLPPVALAWAKSMATGQPYESEFRMRRADGAYRWHISRASPLKGEDGEIVRWIGTNTEIEDQKAVARLLSDANTALESRVEERTRELMEAEAALRQSQKMEAVGQLTGGIAHDFNNLLTGIMGSISVIERRLKAGRTAGLDRYTGAASAAAERAAALTHRLLAFARRQPLDTKALDINRLTLGMQDILQRTLGEHIEMQSHLAADLWLALADANQFDNALLNLVINARDAMPRGGKLTIETRNVHLDRASAQATGDVEPGDYVAVTVSDTGIGMSADVVAHAFDPFFTTKPTGQGSGLGLSMIYGFIKQSGGHTRIDSEVGRGTSITLFLRRANASRDEVQCAGHAVVPTGHGEKVLVVEDDATVRSLMTGVLDELGYRYIDAADPLEAVDLLQSDADIDLLITDVGLPYLNGRQLAEIARLRRPQLRVLFVTGYAESAADRAGFLLPGMDLMTKPFKLDAFATTVRSLLGPTESK